MTLPSTEINTGFRVRYAAGVLNNATYYTLFFSSVINVWVPGAKTIVPIANKFGFFLSNFFGSEKFPYDPFSNLKDVSKRSISKLWPGLSKMVYYIFE
jgi:hypothetical protein